MEGNRGAHHPSKVPMSFSDRRENDSCHHRVMPTKGGLYQQASVDPFHNGKQTTCPELQNKEEGFMKCILNTFVNNK